MCRLWNGGAAGELLLPDGVGSGFFVKLLLTADKPALCHVLGRRSFAHDYFSPNCKCSENAGQLYDFFYGSSYSLVWILYLLKNAVIWL